MERLRCARDRLFVDGQKRAHVEVRRPSCVGEEFALVGQVHHGGRPTGGNLCVCHEVYGHRVGDGPRHGIGLAHIAYRLHDALLKFCLADHVSSFRSAPARRGGARRMQKERRRFRQRPCNALRKHAPYTSVN